MNAPRSLAERHVSAAARLAARLNDAIGEQSSSAIVARAYGGPIGSLQRVASSVRADLYIGHYVAGLHAAGRAPQQHGARLGFDAEDCHLGEERDDLRTVIVRTVKAAGLPPFYRCRAADWQGLCRALRPGHTGDRAECFATGDGCPRQTPPGTPARLLALADHRSRSRPSALLAGDGESGHARGVRTAGDDRWGHGSTLLAMARDLGIGDRLRLLPVAPPAEMVRLAAAYDVGLSLETDVSENRQLCLTNNIFTYLLAGVPAVMSDTPAQRQLARDRGEAAALVSLSDPQAVAAAIDRLASGVDAAKAHAARLGRERYNWNVDKKTLLASVEATFAEAPCRR